MTTEQSKRLARMVDENHSHLLRYIIRRCPGTVDFYHEDVCQDVFVKAARALARGDNPRNERAWLLTIAANSMKDIYRKRSRRRAVTCSLDETEHELTRNDLYLDEIHEGVWEQRLHAEEIVNKILTDNQRTVFVRLLEGYTFVEVGEEMGVEVGTVKSALYRAKVNITNRLEGFENAGSVRPDSCPLRTPQT